MTAEREKRDLKTRLISLAGAAYLHLVGRTSVLQRVDDPLALLCRRERRPCLYAFWHNTQVYLSYDHRGEGAHVVVSQSKDGEYIAGVMDRMGLHAVRGSTSRGGARALLEIVRLINAGDQVGVTPDGPKGPVYKVQGGIISAATMTGVPVIPVTAISRRRLTFRSWDKFVVPLPFSHNVVAHGKPLLFSETSPPEEAALQLEQALNENTANAEKAEAQAPSYVASLFAAFLQGVFPLFVLLLFPAFIIYLCARYESAHVFRGLKDRVWPQPNPPAGKKVIWIHVASLGEWQAVAPLVVRLKNQPDLFPVVTVAATTAKESIASQIPDVPVHLMPLDVPFVMNAWYAKLGPYAVILVESELWPSLLSAAQRRYVPVVIVNGRLSDRGARRWSRMRAVAARLFGRVNAYLVRSVQDAKNFEAAGAAKSRISVTGNLKWDSVVCISPAEKRAARASLGISDREVVVVGGSTWDGEEKILLRLLEEPDARLILAPRRLQRVAEAEADLRAANAAFQRWSDVKAGAPWKERILLVDTLGDLGALYRAGDLAFVGGSLFPKGGQSPLEPASARLPVVFGPSMENFRIEAALLLEKEAAIQGSDESAVVGYLRQLLRDPAERQRRGDAAARVAAESAGSTERTFAALQSLLGF